MADLPNPGLDPTALFGPQGPVLPPQQRAMAQALAAQQGGNANPSFTDPAYTTLGQIDLLRRQALHNTTEQDPARSWAGVLGNIAQTWGGLQQQGRAEALQKQGMEYSNRAQQPAQGGGGGGGGPGLLGGGRGATDTPQSLASYYTSQGLPPVAAAAMAATQYAESGLNPNARKVGDGRDGSDSTGYGQWNAQRGRDKVAYAASIGRAPNDPQVNRDFSLVEMGMKGDPSTPGYGTQLKARQALLGAQNPQQATAAALAYENPANKPAEYQKRLALTNALVGGGAAGGASGAAAPAGAGRQPVQVAQAQNPMGPFAGMTPAQASFNSMNPYTQGNQEMVRGMYSPQRVDIPGGGSAFTTVGQSPNANTSVKGALPAPFTTGDTSLTGVTRTTPDGSQTQFALPPGNTGAAPGASPSAGGGAAPPASPIPPVVDQIKGWSRDQAQQKAEADNEANIVNAARNGLGEARQHLADIESFRALGKDIDSGAIPMAQRFAASHGFQWGGSDANGRLQAYQAMAQQLLGENDKFADRIGGLSTTPEGKELIANYLENKFTNAVAVGEIANSGKGNTSQRAQQIYSYQRAPYYTSQKPSGGAPQGGTQSAQGGKGTGTASAASTPPPKVDEAGYKALKSGDLYTRPDGTVMRKK